MCKDCYHFYFGFNYKGQKVSCALGGIREKKCLRNPSRYIKKDVSIIEKDQQYRFQPGYQTCAH